MLPILWPIGIAVLGGLAWRKASKKAATTSIGAETNGLTPDRAIIYKTALEKLQDPAKLMKLAATFRAEGLEPHAVMLEKRAQLRSLPQEQKRARRAVYRKAMGSTNREAINAVADAYESEGATSAAENLRTYAAGLQ